MNNTNSINNQGSASGDPRIPKRKRALAENSSIFGGSGIQQQVSLINQLPLEMRLLTSHSEDDRIQQQEYEREEQRLMLERMRRQKEKEKAMAMLTGRDNDTDSDDSEGEESTTDWKKEIEKFKKQPIPAP